MKKNREYLLFSFLFLLLMICQLFSFRQLVVTMSDTWANLILCSAIAGFSASFLFLILEKKKKHKPVKVTASILALVNVLGIVCLLLSALALCLWCLGWLFGGAPDIH